MNKIDSAGFTLIELVVVLAIAALGISLVAPNMIRVYENFKVSVEERKLAELMDAVRMKAFFRNAAYEITLKDHSFRVANKDVKFDFDYLSFPPQQFTVNGHGFADLPRIRYHVPNQDESRTMETGPGNG